MKRSQKKRLHRCGSGVALLLAASMCLAMFTPASGVAKTPGAATAGGATFDLYSTYPEQMLAPATGKTSTSMPLDVRNIESRGSGKVALSVTPDTAGFAATIKPATVYPTGNNGKASARIYVNCSKSTPEGTVGYVKVTGKRGNESHRIWLKATATSSLPSLVMSRGVPFTGQGHQDNELQTFVGKPVVWHVAAKNNGADTDTYKLGFKSDFPCDVTFRNQSGRKVSTVKLKGMTTNLLYPKPYELTAEVTPRIELVKNQPRDVTLVLGPGKNTGARPEVKVQVVNPGMLFCVNDQQGIRPHAHQVMPSESTTFLFHVTNTGKKTEDVKLALGGDTTRWMANMGRADIRALAPGATATSLLKMTAPRDGVNGERGQFVVTARSGGRSEAVTVASEVTDTPNVYFWSVDSMNPEYLYLNRAGTGKGKDGDWLMPNTQAFISQGENYTNAKDYLPSATDMNHTNAMAGTYTGTQGIFMVGGTFKGFTKHDEVLSGDNTMDLMRYGADGKPIQRIFEVAKEQSGGKALTGFWSNKNWLSDLEAQRSVDVEGQSEKWPLFFEPPYKYRAAGDPKTDNDPSDPLSATARSLFHTNNGKTIVLPTILGEFDMFYGLRLLNTPIALLFGKNPGMHEEDRYIYSEFQRTITEEDPDVSYINIGDLDNTGHFTGASWAQDEWVKSSKGTAYDTNIYSPWVRRDECLDIAREADALFGDFVGTLKARGEYDNSTIVLLSDHGMENLKDPKKGYQVIDLRDILRDNGLLRFEDYNEAGGTEINLIWSDDPVKTAKVQKTLEDYTIDDPKLGKVHPLAVINRKEMKEGKDFGSKGKVLPGELYSDYWINHPDPVNGEQWPDLFVFPLYNYQVVAHGDALSTGINNVGFSLGIRMPDEVKVGFPAAHGGLQTEAIPLIFKAPASYQGYKPGTVNNTAVRIGDIAPTIYEILGWPAPSCVDGKPLP
ncbi:MAG TPA: alkaline phosphatase family protein [Candidatus Anoxymicrobiaceae bacterium]